MARILFAAQSFGQESARCKTWRGGLWARLAAGGPCVRANRLARETFFEGRVYAVRLRGFVQGSRVRPFAPDLAERQGILGRIGPLPHLPAHPLAAQKVRAQELAGYLHKQWAILRGRLDGLILEQDPEGPPAQFLLAIGACTLSEITYGQLSASTCERYGAGICGRYCACCHQKRSTRCFVRQKTHEPV